MLVVTLGLLSLCCRRSDPYPPHNRSPGCPLAVTVEIELCATVPLVPEFPHHVGPFFLIELVAHIKK